MGQMAQALQNPNTYAPQPSGFNAQEWLARAGAMGVKGLGQGLQNYSQGQQAIQQRGGGGGTMMPAQGAQPVDSSYFLPQQSIKPNPFYGGYGS